MSEKLTRFDAENARLHSLNQTLLQREGQANGKLLARIHELEAEVDRKREVLVMIRAHAWNDVNLREGGVGVGTPKFQSPLVARQYIRSIDWALGEGQRKVTRGYTCDKCGHERWEEVVR